VAHRAARTPDTTRGVSRCNGRAGGVIVMETVQRTGTATRVHLPGSPPMTQPAVVAGADVATPSGVPCVVAVGLGAASGRAIVSGPEHVRPASFLGMVSAANSGDRAQGDHRVAEPLIANGVGNLWLGVLCPTPSQTSAPKRGRWGRRCRAFYAAPPE
jgi:hypothetical protein